MKEEYVRALASGIANPIAKQLHANSLVGVGSIAYLAKKGVIDLEDYLKYMNDLKDSLLQAADYDTDTKEAIKQEFEFYQHKLKM
ncbi:hypothetical protein AAX05_01400 [Moraxella bovoculi]|uniref:hypothetical protein n=1 Tax=Moraxella bovoculi TaxID=386891 RepID=UPI0006244AE1|nr:hypothetical protein [Moraxella bovoculi]AKG09052.1 hypothetical protein AAX05_01400 [Moraxella bovoculi]